MRSSPTAVCAIVLVIFARSCTGLKNLLRYARNTVSAPTVIAPARISAVPRQSTNAVHSATTIVDDRRQQRLDAPRLERRVHRRPARLVHAALLRGPAGRTPSPTRTDSSPCWTTATMSLCRFRTSCVTLLHRLLEAHHEQQQERRHADGDQREVPVEPEHEPQHADDRHQVDEDAERRRRREVLHRGHVARDRRQQRSRLLVVVEA